MPLATGQHDLYAPYYRLAELRLPKGPPAGEPNWDVIRPVVETALFGDQFKRDVHYAALTLDGQALASYGDCFVLLRDKMIAHRASAFEENSILFMKHHDIKIFEVDRLPTGYRAAWEDRGKLAAAKLASQIDPHTPADQFAGVLMRPASSRVRDDFIEIHLFGPITAFTFEKVTHVSVKSAGGGKAKKRKRHRPRRGDTNLSILADKLAAAGAEFESRA